MTYLEALTDDARRALYGIGLDDKVPGILDALAPVLENAAKVEKEREQVTENGMRLFGERNRIARELADLRDEHHTEAQQIAAGALKQAADAYRDEKYPWDGTGDEPAEIPAVEDAVDFLLVRVGEIEQGEVTP